MNKKWFSLVFFLVLAFTAFYFYHKYSSAPSIQVQNVAAIELNGDKFDWNVLKGEKTLVVFGGSWCGECRQELQNLLQLQNNELKDLKIVVLSDEPLEKIIAYKEKFAYPFLFLKTERPFSQIGIYSVPLNYLLNEELQVLKEKEGDFAWEDASEREHLLTLINT